MVKPLKTSNAEVVAEKALKKPAVKVASPHKKPRFVTPGNTFNQVLVGCSKLYFFNEKRSIL